MSSDRLIEELKEALDRLDSFERAITRINIAPGLVSVLRGNRPAISFPLDQITAAITKAFAAVEGPYVSSVEGFISDFYCKSKFYLYIAIRYTKCIAIAQKATVRKQSSNKLSVFFRVRKFLFKELHAVRVFQFVQPRLHHMYLGA